MLQFSHLTPQTLPAERVYVIDFYGGHSRIRTYDFHRVKVALYR